MHHRLIALLALAALCLPSAAALAQNEQKDNVAALQNAFAKGEGIHQADLGTEDNDWFLTRENGVCRMYSFNDPLVIQADASDPLGTQFRFGMIDRKIPEAHGTQVEMIVALRGSDDAQFKGFQVGVVASHDIKNYGYLMPVPLDELVTHYPNGFELVLMDKNQKQILKSSTRGTGKHLAELAQCARKG